MEPITIQKPKIDLNKSDDVWLIDTDYSFDDQIAFAYLINKIKIIAITVCGSGTEHKPHVIKRKIEDDLKNKYNRTDINVYAGSDRPYIDYQTELKDEPIFDPYNIKKTNYSNFINKEDDVEKDIGLRISNIAAVKICEIVRENGKNLNILTLGPLTNLSLAVLIDSTIKDQFRNLFISGGSYNNLGNSGNCAEYNFRVDPVASKNVINYFKNITLFPLEIEAQINFKELRKIKPAQNSIFSEFYDALNSIDDDDEQTRSHYSFLSIFTVLVLINSDDEKLVKDMINRPCEVDIIGRYTRGGMAIEKYDYIKSGKFNDILIVEEVDSTRFYEIFGKEVSS
jgi:inosine-uridine nucleoside N-ribohydrolase